MKVRRYVEAAISRVAARSMDLDSPTHAVGLETGLEVPMPDGVTLVADRYYPRDVAEAPTILIRVPYGRQSIGVICRLYAERGLQVVVQTCRGTFGSDGAFDPLHQERRDGAATVEWIEDQEWFNGQLAAHGVSYGGFTLWALASETGDRLDAISTQSTSSNFGAWYRRGDAILLEPTMKMLRLLYNIQRYGSSYRRYAVNLLRSRRRDPIEQSYDHRPLEEKDVAVYGESTDLWTDMRHMADPAHPDPGETDFSKVASDISVPNCLVTGWRDLLLEDVCADYHRMRDAETEPHLLIGPWAHDEGGLHTAGIRESIAWFRATLLDDETSLRDDPVRMYVFGAEEWRTCSKWPPDGYEDRQWHFQPDGGLGKEVPTESTPDTYTFDPRNPTPVIGGDGFVRGTADEDIPEVCARPDVVTYESGTIDTSFEVVGYPSATLAVDSSAPHADYAVCICEIAPDGTGTKVCDGIRRVSPDNPPAESGSSRTVDVELLPIAYQFSKGHRIRVIVSGGAFPVVSPNPGTDGDGVRPVEHELYHDQDRCSGIRLPVRA